MNKKFIFSLLIFALSFAFICRGSLAQPKPTSSTAKKIEAAPEIGYTVSMSKPSTHLLEVEMRLRWPEARKAVELIMPVWTPGSYLIREYARHVQDFKVADTRGTPLRWEKINKNTWRISGEDLKEFAVTYNVYANELTVRTNELNDSHAFWNNGALLMYPANHLNAPSQITVKPYEKWKVATGLQPVAGKVNTFSAENFDILFDSPFEVSNFIETTFTVRGVPHRIVITGEGNYDLKQIAVDTTKIAEEGIKIFGELPMKDYLFIVNLRGGGGLEHLNSTALQFNRFGFRPRAGYLRFLNLVAHEYFHLWNVKRIRPDALGPFDYENENYTKLLWVAEGVTAYYEGLLLERAGLINDQEFLGGKAQLITDLQTRPGRFETSLEEASMDAWIKYYRPDENSINNQISYYDKGEIIGMLLDIEIRTRSAGKGSLDTVMKYLYDEFYRKGRNYTPEDFQKAAEKAAGGSLENFFTKYVRGEAEIDYNAIVNGIGLQVTRTEPNKGKPYIGADMADEGGRLMIRTIPAGTPAYEQGLNTGDQIVAIDGYRASQAFLQMYLADKKPGNKVRLTIFRFDKLQDVNFTLGSNDRPDYEFEPLSQPTVLQRRLYRDYLGGETAAP